MLKNTRLLREEAFSGWLLQLFKNSHEVNLLLIFLEMIKPRRVIGLFGLVCYNTAPKVCKMRQPIWKSLWNFREAKAPLDAAEADFVTALSLSVFICLCLYLSLLVYSIDHHIIVWMGIGWIDWDWFSECLSANIFSWWDNGTLLLMQMLTHNEIFLCEFQRGVIDVTAADYHWEKQTSFFLLFPLFPVKCFSQ